MSVRLSVKAVTCTSILQSVYADRGGVILVFYFILKASISSLVLKKVLKSNDALLSIAWSWVMITIGMDVSLLFLKMVLVC